ncbi:hypothetical protein OG552_03940 [Streptomyces sp. NBC_01476]|uniref:hypothetical protein n=1 Tax=Streptomyces sp. NBC_01476 TaxID=2903881 RepID=UPI002E303A57|nr:hypothetical protein [Streptomyces sp. NBC_01476]
MNTAEPTGRSPRHPVRPSVLVAVLLVASAVIVTLVLTGNGSHHGGDGPGHGSLGRAAPGEPAGDADSSTDFHAGDAGLVVLDGVSGRIQVSADPGARTVRGSFHRADGAPARVRTAIAPAGADGSGTLTVSCQDAGGAGTPCAGELTLTVPEHTGLRLRQTSGETVLSGLGGALTVTAASDRFTAQDLHPSRAELTLTSGSADLGFADPPDTLAVRATSAAMTLRLPAAGGGYAVTTAATSADVQVQVPRRADSPHRVSLQVLSGSLAVLPS